ncbi:hypothetical protein MFFC18_47230 [Mariniblastus fucicola]|uniref:Chaperone protein DnaJ n=1 Tax=Mariniblastus fucicola TaxID=980251 RepID=A0A5B9PHM5_9BACT|nr:hypothetical protein MFFC18_47230 [Mariniblastus fucicola]
MTFVKMHSNQIKEILSLTLCLTFICVSGCGYVNSGIQKAKCEVCSGSGSCALCEGNGKGIFYGTCGVCKGDGLCDGCSGTGVNFSD